MSASTVPRPPSRVLPLLLVALGSLGVLALSQFALSQQATEKPQNIPLPRPSGMSTGGIHACGSETNLPPQKLQGHSFTLIEVQWALAISAISFRISTSRSVSNKGL